MRSPKRISVASRASTGKSDDEPAFGDKLWSRVVERVGGGQIMTAFEFLFMADCQLGAYAAFSGMSAEQVEAFAARDMKVEPVPRVEGFEWDASRYAEAIEAANALRPAFVVMGGDMVDDPSSRPQYEALMAITARLDPDIPMHWVPGNHDIAPDTVVPTAASIAEYREAYGPDYYSFDRGDTRFVVLDTVVIDHPELVPGALDEQMEFLRWEIDRLVDEGRRGIVFGHHPLFIRQADEADTYWNLPAERRAVLLDELQRGAVSHVFAGHWHRNAVARHEDLEMVTSGPVGYPLGDDPPGLRIVRVEPTRIVHHYHGLGDIVEAP